ncbi:MAG: MarR family transcriptional regulator [Humibacillus sp.]|nr:MarR family transcriptional regulator [Humibacillus sp.]MDN5777596.1 MarR family transcriptional regulator [Humibacillus sp.]
MQVSTDKATDLFHALIRVQKLLLAARTIAPKIHPGMETAAYPVMFTVHTMGPVGISDVAMVLHSDVSTVSRQVSGLFAHGLLDKQPDPADGRATLVSLTDAGRQSLDEVQLVRGQWFQELLADWQADETDLFTEHLQRLGDSLDKNLRDRGAAAPTIFTASDRPSDKEH